MKETHENIINATLRVAYRKKNLKSITLSDIAKEAKISRQAIYSNHFSSVDAIFEEIFETIDTEIFKQFKKSLIKSSKTYSVFEIIAYDLFPLVYKHKDWLKILYNTDISSTWKKYIFQKYILLYNDYYAPKIDDEEELSKIVLISIAEYILGIIEGWVSEDIPKAPTLFAEDFLRLMNLSPLKLLD